MAYTPTIAFMWFGKGYVRTLYVPTSISLEIFSGGKVLPVASKQQPQMQIHAREEQEASSEGPSPSPRQILKNKNKITSLNHLINVFCNEPNKEEDGLLSDVFDEIGDMPGCMEDYFEYETSVGLGDIPAGLAIAQWFVRNNTY